DGHRFRPGMVIGHPAKHPAAAPDGLSGMRWHAFCRMLKISEEAVCAGHGCAGIAPQKTRTLQKPAAKTVPHGGQDGEQGSVLEDAVWRLLSPRRPAKRCRTHPCRAREAVRRIHAPFLAAGLLLRRAARPAVAGPDAR